MPLIKILPTIKKIMTVLLPRPVLYKEYVLILVVVSCLNLKGAKNETKLFVVKNFCKMFHVMLKANMLMVKPNTKSNARKILI